MINNPQPAQNPGGSQPDRLASSPQPAQNPSSSQPDRLALHAKRPKRFRRFHGYDYNRGASIFVTFAVKGRPRVFGRVVGDHVELSAAGKIAVEVILRENRRPGAKAVAVAFIVMPDHVHLRLVLAPCDDAEPLRNVGQFVNNVKRWIRVWAAEAGVAVEWEPNYHDHVCCSRFINEKVDAYIGYNALKWSLMHGDPPPLKVVEPFISQRIPDEEWWSAVGNVGLLAPERRIAAVSLSRSLRKDDVKAAVARLVKAAREGWVIASTFVSPGEIAVERALEAEGLPRISASPDELKMVYRPRVEETSAFAAGRLAVVSRDCGPDVTRYDAWHGMNAALAQMAGAAGGGLGVYVHRKGVPEMRWERVC